MPTLPTYRTVTGIKEFVLGDGPPAKFEQGDRAADVRYKFNTNFSKIEDFVNLLGVAVQDITAVVFGRGVISGLSPSIGTGLTINYTAGSALVGFIINMEAGSISVLPNASPGYVYLCQDGTWVVNTTGEQPDITSFEFCRYEADETRVLTITTEQRVPQRILPCKLRKITGQVLAYVEVDTATVFRITHEAELVIPGFKHVTSLDPTVEVSIYNSSEDTPNSFSVLLRDISSYYYYYGEGYEYYEYSNEYGWYYWGTHRPVWLKYTRTGLAYE